MFFMVHDIVVITAVYFMKYPHCFVVFHFIMCSYHESTKDSCDLFNYIHQGW